MQKTWALCLVSILSNLPFCLLAQSPPTPATPPAPAVSTNAPALPFAWQIVQLEGDVQARSNADSAWTNATLNQILPAAASVRSGANGKATIKAADAAGVTIQSNTTIEVGTLTQTGDTTKAEVKALSGKSLFLINKLKTLDSSFTVETPTAIVGVRGTVFTVKVADDAESSRVACFHGEVRVKGKGDEPGEVIVKEKMGTNVVKNKPPTDPDKVAAEDEAEWERMKKELQTSTPLASIIPAIGGYMEEHERRLGEAESLVSGALRAQKGTKKSEQDFKVFEAALVQYYKDTGTLPTKEQGLQALLEDPKVQGWHGPYLGKESNLLDPYGKPYKWLPRKSPAGKDLFEVRSGGPDLVPNTDDDHVLLVRPDRMKKLASEAKPVAP